MVNRAGVISEYLHHHSIIQRYFARRSLSSNGCDYIFLLSLIIIKESDLFDSASRSDSQAKSSNLLIYWGVMIFALVVIGYLTGTTNLFEVNVLYMWAVVTPVLIIFANFIFRTLLLLSLKSEENQRKVVIVVRK